MAAVGSLSLAEIYSLVVQSADGLFDPFSPSAQTSGKAASVDPFSVPDPFAPSPAPILSRRVCSILIVDVAHVLIVHAHVRKQRLANPA
jgi:hypothetical protein